MFMRRLFDSEAGTPIESFFIEAETLPLRFILQGRQLMYYHTLLKKSESELVKRVYIAQREFPSKNDWLSQTKKTLLSCEIYLSEDEIKECSKYKFKKLVDSKIKQKAAEYLTELQMKHSKTKYLLQTNKIRNILVQIIWKCFLKWELECVQTKPISSQCINLICLAHYVRKHQAQNLKFTCYVVHFW